VDPTAFRKSFRRRAIVLEIGGFRPPTDPRTSRFGQVLCTRPGEPWPRSHGEPMLALCQLNLAELPFRPPRLDDIEMITVFIGPDSLPADEPNGSGWCLRTYRSLDEVAPIARPVHASPLRPLPMRPTIVEEDFPCWEDVASEVRGELEDSYDDLFENTPGFKLGGWPTLIQSEIFWAPWNRHPAAPEYVFQIDSTGKGNWSWVGARVAVLLRPRALLVQ
jgi:hypothetical protein